LIFKKESESNKYSQSFFKTLESNSFILLRPYFFFLEDVLRKLRESGYEEQVEKNDSYLSTEVKQIQVLERLLSQYDL
jgi:hypothetical protein